MNAKTATAIIERRKKEREQIAIALRNVSRQIQTYRLDNEDGDEDTLDGIAEIACGISEAVFENDLSNFLGFVRCLTDELGTLHQSKPTPRECV